MQKIYYFLGNHFLKFCMILARIPGFWRLLAWLFGFFIWIFSEKKTYRQKNQKSQNPGILAKIIKTLKSLPRNNRFFLHGFYFSCLIFQKSIIVNIHLVCLRILKKFYFPKIWKT